MLEIIVVISILVILLAVAFMGSRGRDSGSVKRMDQIQSMGQMKRISAFLNKELKECDEILLPLPQKGSPVLACRKKSGQIAQYYADTTGNFVYRAAPSENPQEQIVARKMNARTQLKQIEFRLGVGDSIEFFARLSILESGQEQNLLEFVDAFTTRR
ncbi:MAG: hypothetical protein H3C47_12240 [Candidatus Cloacimonetes bacterium]|nr:hypothetical protein [Candidatus Cloacimonadota bacterium]